MVRPPAVAGSFYPASPLALRREVEHLTAFPGQPRQAVAVIAPHAGYIYSGRVAGETYRQVQLPDRFVLLCPNHTGRGVPVAIMSEGTWRTPLGDVPIDVAMAEQLKQASPLFEEDSRAHEREHSLEVHLPFLQCLKPGFSFVPISVGAGDLPVLKEIGLAIAPVIARSRHPVLIVASTDMTHYEPADQARELDHRAIAAILALDGEQLYQTVRRFRISMCGYGPTTAALIAARGLGAQTAQLIRYAHSGEVSGDYQSVVGYAGIVIR